MGSKAKEIVRLRFKKLKDGGRSAYFDIYRNGVREYLWQSERLLPDTDEASKDYNDALMVTLEERRRSLIAELTIDKSGIADRSFNTDLTLLQWIDIYEKELSARVCASYQHHLITLKSYLTAFNADLLLKELDDAMVTSFYEFLKEQPCSRHKDSTLTEGSIWYYLKMLANCMNVAIRERHIDHNPCRSMLKVCRKRQKPRELSCLTQNELIRLIDTPYHYPMVKRMFLFSCFTGAKVETISALRWKHIYRKDGRKWGKLMQTRSGKEIDIPLTDMAIACLPPRCRAKSSCPVFTLDLVKCSIFHHLKQWGKAAGVNTSLNFSVAKNTYASLLLKADADFYTAGYMMGFSSISYMEEYEGYLNEKRSDVMERMDAALCGFY